jgi:hypothetical protein
LDQFDGAWNQDPKILHEEDITELKQEEALVGKRRNSQIPKPESVVCHSENGDRKLADFRTRGGQMSESV